MHSTIHVHITDEEAVKERVAGQGTWGGAKDTGRGMKTEEQGLGRELWAGRGGERWSKQRWKGGPGDVGRGYINWAGQNRELWAGQSGRGGAAGAGRGSGGGTVRERGAQARKQEQRAEANRKRGCASDRGGWQANVKEVH
ncbi:hypothetical protein E2C01_080701 [Portunus trituberculatus]|uniref:Uncharacterized protein n=1 Tax=Portunus trituberculatus TaxID=210409 RepID=A0A5B7IQ28_PORTR|nr:hypothetical protein [Portunus trituberculatus]